MDSLSDSASRILEIEARQDDALRQLEALESRIEQVLAEQLSLLAASRRCDATSAGKAA